jgi:hypothetical protein
MAWLTPEGYGNSEGAVPLAGMHESLEEGLVEGGKVHNYYCGEHIQTIYSRDCGSSVVGLLPVLSAVYLVLHLHQRLQLYSFVVISHKVHRIPEFWCLIFSLVDVVQLVGLACLNLHYHQVEGSSF